MHTIASTVLELEHHHPLHWAKEQRGGAARKKEKIPLLVDFFSLLTNCIRL
jgi:hypothetical protein